MLPVSYILCLRIAFLLCSPLANIVTDHADIINKFRVKFLCEMYKDWQPSEVWQLHRTAMRAAACDDVGELAGRRTGNQGADFVEQAFKVDWLGFKGIAANLNRPFALIFKHIGCQGDNGDVGCIGAGP